MQSPGQKLHSHISSPWPQQIPGKAGSVGTRCVPVTGQMAAQSTSLSAHTRLAAHAFNSSILNNIYYLTTTKKTDASM